MIRDDVHDRPADNATPLGENATARSPIAPDGRPEPGRRYAVPAREGRAVRLARGESLTLVNTHGTQVCDLWAFSAANLAEFLSWEHARGRARPHRPAGRRRPRHQPPPADPDPDEDTSPGVHDTLIAACDLFRYLGLGVADYHDNCSDNLRMALAAIGERAPEVPQPFNVWMNIPVGPDGAIAFLPTVSKPGDRLTLRAEIDCIVVMSACPQDMVPINGPDMRPVELHFEVT